MAIKRKGRVAKNRRPKGHTPKDPGKLCNGKKKGKVNEYCGRPAGWGTQHAGWGRCKLHGGASPQYNTHAQENRAAEEVERYGLPKDVDPTDALLQELARTAGHVEWLRVKIGELESDHSLHRPVGGGDMGIPDVKPHIWLELYRAERKHLTDVAKTCIGVGIEERKVRIIEQQGQLFAEVIRGILTELGMIDHPETPKIVRKHLSVIDAEGRLINEESESR